MFPDSYSNSPLQRFWAVVTRSFAVGTFFGVPVRMYWAAAILTPLLLLTWVPAATALERWTYVAIGFLGLFVVIWTHEMAHILMARRLGIGSDRIMLSPLGGVAHMAGPTRSPREELQVALAGPLVHVPWLLALWLLEWLLPATVVAIDGWLWCPVAFALWYLHSLNLGLLLFNLLPIFPLDGGRTLRALLALRVHANRATMWATAIGIGGGAVMTILGLVRPGVEGSIGVFIGISCIQASLHERLMARHVLVYRDHVRDLWETDGDAWKLGAQPDRERRPGWLARKRAERAERKAAAAAAADAAFEREVDQALARVQEVGMAGLSERERQVLQAASRKKRGVG